MTVLVLIRHGETDFVGRKLAGRLAGVHLNDRGRQQARAVAQVLAGAPFKALYSSPMERAVETAWPLADLHHMPVQIRPGLTELDYGHWQGRTFKQLQRINLWKEVLRQPAVVRFPGGESFVEAQKRVADELEAICALHADGDLVACYTHADVVRLAVAHYLQVPLNAYQRLSISTASISVIERIKDQVRVPYVNLVELAGLAVFQRPSPTQAKPQSHKRKPIGA